jgi:hypothetical protein
MHVAGVGLCVGDCVGNDVGLAVGLAEGDAVGTAVVGVAVGDAEGAAVGEPVGAAVLSQQVKYVLPSCVGQQRSPAPKPNSAHRACMPQSLAVEGAAVVGAGLGRGVAPHRPVAESHVPEAQSFGSSHCCPATHFRAQTPPQSTSASSDSRVSLSQSLLSQQSA